MPSTYSSNLRLELIASGEQANTWGNTTDNNLGTLIEEALTGVVQIDISSGNRVLTALNGAYDQARAMVIIATGAGTGTHTIFTPANVSKVYIVDNTASTDVEMSTQAAGTPTTVLVPAGTSKFVYTDGTDFFDGVTAAEYFTADTVTITGTPTASTDAATVAYVGASLNTFLPKAGGTMTGAIDMGATNKITSLANPTLAYDAATKEYVDTQVGGGGIPVNTVMLFVQPSTPTGWTQIITQNDKALRIVSGSTGGSAGGSVAFSSAFVSQPVTGSVGLSGLSTSVSVSISGTTGGRTLSESQIASHSHTLLNQIMTPDRQNVAWVAGAYMQGIGSGTYNTGGGGSHDHSFSGSGSGSGSVTGSASFTGNPINMAVQYVDVIQCYKN